MRSGDLSHQGHEAYFFLLDKTERQVQIMTQKRRQNS